MEFYKKIKGFEEYYEASNLGNIRRVGALKNLKQINNGHDYMHVSLSAKGKVKKFYVHRLVALAFLENIELKEEVNHIDGVRNNNSIYNLEWVTRSENHFHRYKILNKKGANFGKTGSLNWRSKKVRKLDLEGVFLCEYPGVMEAMRQTGINEASIRCCIHGKQKKAGGFKWEYTKIN